MHAHTTATLAHHPLQTAAQVRGVSMAECADLAREFGERAAAELGVPMYLYEEAVEQDGPREYRRLLPDVRLGEYEGIAERIGQERWKPDYGPASFVPEWGATATGARKFLIAYNVNLLGTKQQAHRIAMNVREQGRPSGPDAGPGRCAFTKGLGWYVDEYNMSQGKGGRCEPDAHPPTQPPAVPSATCHTRGLRASPRRLHLSF